jgi:hypothetical protein
MALPPFSFDEIKSGYLPVARSLSLSLFYYIFDLWEVSLKRKILENQRTHYAEFFSNDFPAGEC